MTVADGAELSKMLKAKFGLAGTSS